jgi:hypothetical protein
MIKSKGKNETGALSMSAEGSTARREGGPARA